MESTSASGIRNLNVESAKCKWNPHFVCGFHIHKFFICSNVLVYIFYLLGGHQQVQSQLLC